MIDPNSPAHKLVGAVLNTRWRLSRLLGEGGMGAVYEADGVHGEGKRAVKVLHPEFGEDEQILQRFFTEAQATQGFNHPNIAAVLESSRAEDGTPYIVMELLQGINLGTYIDQNQGIPPQQAVAILYQVLQALWVAHSRKVIHRDLKPDNIFLIRDAHGNFHVKLLDFGIAKVMDAAGGMGSKTRTGVLLGTPGYMSPEQIKNSKGVDPRSDLWSVAIIFYEMLTGTSPFPADNEFARLTAVLTNEARPIEQVVPQLAPWSPFFRRALAKDPNQRFQTAEEMANAMTSVPRGSVMPERASVVEHSASLPASIQQPVTMQTGQPHPTTAVSAGSMVPPMGSHAPSYAPVPGHAGPTHISAQKPYGTPTISNNTPAVQVVQAPPLQHQGAPWWVVFVVGFVCLGVGFAVGMLVTG